MKKINNERQARWVLVEALCLCAALEREFGRVEAQRIRSFDYPPQVIEEAVRLAARHQPGRFLETLWRLFPALIAARLVVKVCSR